LGSKVKSHLGPILGAVAGIIDVIPMLAQGLPWEADASAFCLWVIAGFFIQRTDLQLPAPLKGIAISFLLLIPAAILIAAKEPFSLIPISIMTLLLGAALGYAIKKVTA